MGDGMLDVASFYMGRVAKKTDGFLHSILLINTCVPIKADAFGAIIVI